MGNIEKERSFWVDLDSMSKKELKKYWKKIFGSNKEGIPKPSKNMYMSRNGWISV